MKLECKQLESVTARPDAAALVHEKVLSLLLTEKPGLILDIPAGQGAFAAKARELGYEVRCGAIDVSRFKVHGIKCHRVDLNKPWPFTSSMFDYVALVEALEPLENPLYVLVVANRVLTL